MVLMLYAYIDSPNDLGSIIRYIYRDQWSYANNSPISTRHSMRSLTRRALQGISTACDSYQYSCSFVVSQSCKSLHESYISICEIQLLGLWKIAVIDPAHNHSPRTLDSTSLEGSLSVYNNRMIILCGRRGCDSCHSLHTTMLVLCACVCPSISTLKLRGNVR